MEENFLLEQAHQDKLYAAEKRISVVRLVLVLFNTFMLVFYLNLSGAALYAAYGIAIFANIYGVLTIVYEPYRYFALFRSVYYTALTDGALIVAWMMATGFMDSQFYVIWYVSLLAVSLRFSIKETIVCTICYAILYLGIWALDPSVQTSFEDILIRIGYLFITGLLGVVLAIAIKDQIQDRVRVMHAEAALKKINNELEVRVQERTTELSTLNNDLTDSINYAKRIQQATLPSHSELKEELKNAEVLFLPKDVVSGDFFWCHHFNSYSIIAVVDCTGHGVPGALMSMIGNNLLNNIVIDREIRNPKRILEKMNLFLNNILNRNVDDYTMNDGMDMTVVALNQTTGQLKFGAAYGQIVLLRNGKAEIHYGDRMAIGGLDRDETFSFNEMNIKLQSEDRIFMFTDGIPDQFGGPRDRKFLRKNLISLLEETSNQPLKKQIESIKVRFLAWKGDQAQTDDVTLVGFEV